MTHAPLQPPEHLALASLFDPGSREQWQAQVAAVLRSSGMLDEPAQLSDVERALSTPTYDGIELRPLYTAGDAPPEAVTGVPGAFPFVRGARAEGAVANGWDVRQRHAHPDPVRSREAVMADLENGVSSLWLVLGAGGIPIGSLSDGLQSAPRYPGAAAFVAHQRAPAAGTKVHPARVSPTTNRASPGDDD